MGCEQSLCKKEPSKSKVNEINLQKQQSTKNTQVSIVKDNFPLSIPTFHCFSSNNSSSLEQSTVTTLVSKTDTDLYEARLEIFEDAFIDAKGHLGIVTLSEMDIKNSVRSID